jgi:hypothetical protein
MNKSHKTICQQRSVDAIRARKAETLAREIASYKNVPTSESVKLAIAGQQVGPPPDKAPHHAFHPATGRRRRTAASAKDGMKAALVVLASALLVACGGGGGSSGGGMLPIAGMPVATTPAEPAPEPAPERVKEKDCTVLLAGDSILRGESLSGALAHRPADRLREAGFIVTDAAVSGQAITLHIGTFLNTPLPERIVVIEWFANDLMLGLPFEGPLRQAVQHVKASGRKVVMTGAYPRGGTQAQRDIVRRIAAEEGAAYAAWDESVGEPMSATDPHPSQAYSDDLAARIVTALRSIAPECVAN